MKEHLDEATLQGYLDGELPRAAAERAATHLTACMTCAEAAREMQNEISLLSTALETEFDVGVPTERLRSRIDRAIAELQAHQPARAYAGSSSVRSWFGALADLFVGSRQRSLGYATVAVVIFAAAALGIIYLKRGAVTSGVEIARKDPPPQAAGPQSSPGFPGTREQVRSPVFTPIVDSSDGNRPRKTRQRQSMGPESAAKLLPGEQAYIKTIAALDAKLKSDAQPMRPGLQVEYEHNLALVNQAIADTRVAAQRNPDDPDTAQFMYSAYQSKVNLLTQVADARLFNTQRK